MIAKTISVFIAAIMIGCANISIHTTETSDNNSITGEDNMSEKLDFKRITLTTNNCTAESDEYELLKTDDGFIITHYFGRWNWDGEGREDFIEKRIEGGDELYSSAAELAGKCGIKDWNGFSGTNPEVLDGRSFTLEAELADGSTIHARGTNMFPYNFDEFSDGIRDMLEN